MEYLITDLTCRSYPYDTHLYEALQQQCRQGQLKIAGCMEDQVDCRYPKFRKGLIDLAGRFPLRVRRYLKAVEYVVNVLMLLQCLYRARPSIVHVQWIPLLEVWPNFEMWWLSCLRRWEVSIVYTVHNVLPHDTGNRYRDAFVRIYRIPDALICHTQEAKNQLVENFGVPSGKIWVIPHGPLSNEVTSIPQEEARSRLQLSLETPLCLLFGFIRPYKGVEFLIDSWRRVRKKDPTAQLILAGQPEDGYGEVILGKIGDLGLEGEVDTHFEFLPQEKLNLYIQAADVLVYPYRSITQSGALLTGLATGRPIVATDVGGFSEMIQHEQTGILVEYGDEEGLAEELVQLLRDTEKGEKLGQSAQEMVEMEYSWDAIAHQTLECYQSVINQS